MSDDYTWSMTITHGKQTFNVAFEPQHPQRIARLKHEVEQLTGVATKYQRLIYRGKELRDDNDSAVAASSKKPSKASATAPALVANAKIMLLFNQAYHQDAAQRASAPPSTAAAAAATAAPSDTQASAPIAPPPPAAGAIEIDSLDDDEVLVHAFRGKANYEFVLKRDAAVLTIKQRLCAILGLSSAQGIRLVVKGKTPADATVLSELLGTRGNTRILKCMVLLQAQQHEMLEKEDELRQLLNELTQLTVDARRVAKQVARNFASREEMTLRVSALVDSAARVHGNLSLLFAHLCPTGSAATPRASSATAAILTQAIEEAAALETSCQALLQRVTLL